MNRSRRSEKITRAGIRHFSDSASNTKPLYDLSLGQPDFAVPARMKAAAVAAIEADHNGYIRTGGEGYVRDLLGASVAGDHPALGEYGVDFDLVVTSGVTGAIYCTLLACCDVDDDVLLPDPYFSPYVDLIRLAGANPAFVDTYPDFNLTADRIRKCVTPKTKVLILNSPNNPTGKTIGREELCEIIEICDENDVVVISDEIYAAFDYTKKHSSVADLTRNAIVLKGFSKSHGATGWRLGYLIAPADLTPIIESVQGKIYVSAPSITHYAIPAALECDYGENVRLLGERRDVVLAALRGNFQNVSCDGGMFVFFDVLDRCKCSASEFAAAASRNGVTLLPGRVFSQIDSHCRISLTHDTEYLSQAVELINLTASQICAANVD